MKKWKVSHSRCSSSLMQYISIHRQASKIVMSLIPCSPLLVFAGIKSDARNRPFSIFHHSLNIRRRKKNSNQSRPMDYSGEREGLFSNGFSLCRPHIYWIWVESIRAWILILVLWAICRKLFGMMCGDDGEMVRRRRWWQEDLCDTQTIKAHRRSSFPFASLNFVPSSGDIMLIRRLLRVSKTWLNWIKVFAEGATTVGEFEVEKTSIRSYGWLEKLKNRQTSKASSVAKRIRMSN